MFIQFAPLSAWPTTEKNNEGKKKKQAYKEKQNKYRKIKFAKLDAIKCFFYLKNPLMSFNLHYHSSSLQVWY